jgi:uncharacterized protein (DUF2336 family)
MPSTNLIDELEDAIADKGLGRRAEILRRVTDLFMSGSGKFSDDQIGLFDEVMSRLVEQVELSAREAFSARLASQPDAPRNTIELLAFDHAISVAAPVLSQSERLSEAALVKNASIMSQDHLLAISKRRHLSDRVTDVLIDRGDPHVLVSTAGNVGSAFSPAGYGRLVDKAHRDFQLVSRIWARSDVPRQELVRLFAQATEDVRSRLEAARPREAKQIRAAVAAAGEKMQELARQSSSEHRDARLEVTELHSKGALNEARLKSLAEALDFDRTAVALSLMCNLPVRVIERSLAQRRFEQMLVFAKSIELNWDTTKALLVLQSPDHSLGNAELEQSFASFTRLQVKTAIAALQFYRLREQADGHAKGLD